MRSWVGCSTNVGLLAPRLRSCSRLMSPTLSGESGWLRSAAGRSASGRAGTAGRHGACARTRCSSTWLRSMASTSTRRPVWCWPGRPCAGVPSWTPTWSGSGCSSTVGTVRPSALAGSCCRAGWDGTAVAGTGPARWSRRSMWSPPTASWSGATPGRMPTCSGRLAGPGRASPASWCASTCAPTRGFEASPSRRSSTPERWRPRCSPGCIKRGGRCPTASRSWRSGSLLRCRRRLGMRVR